MVKRIRWARGFFRAWTVLAVVWILFSGWNEYRPEWNEYDHWFITRRDEAHDEECRKKFAKWPDGRALTWQDYYPEVGSDKETIEANQWLAQVRRELAECEAAKPPIGRALKAESWFDLIRSLLLILFPPLVALIAGCGVGWIIKGFRTT
jgi:hypothetical protein